MILRINCLHVLSWAKLNLNFTGLLGDTKCTDIRDHDGSLNGGGVSRGDEFKLPVHFRMANIGP